ncbi:phosphatase PAP2 family protein [Bacteroidales bacterium]
MNQSFTKVFFWWFLLIAALISSLLLIGQNTDIELLKEINLNRNRVLDPLFRALTHTAGPVAFITPLVVLAIALRKKTEKLKKKAIYLIVAVLTAVLITTSLKYAVKRPRPFETYDFIEKMTSGGSPSFPSGHTTDAFVIATATSIAFPSFAVIFPFFLWAGLVAYSRMALGVHYPVDVLVGIFIGLASSAVWFVVFRKKIKSGD